MTTRRSILILGNVIFADVHRPQQSILNMILSLLACLLLLTPAIAAGENSLGRARARSYPQVPGVVIDHIPKARRIYVGSPSLVLLTNGDYVASHDCFGPRSDEHKAPVTKIFRSRDRGATWKPVSVLKGQFWSTLFLHRGALYILGTSHGYGNIVIRHSLDEGDTWTTPTNAASGILRDDGQYHCAPVPVVEHNGYLWRAFERRDPPRGWASNFRAGMLSAPVDADLLQAASWRSSNFLPGSSNWLAGNFRGWLEGNAVVTPSGEIDDILRVDTPGLPEMAAIVRIARDGSAASFDPATDFIQLPGGAKKFTIRPDPLGGGYWTLASIADASDSASTRLSPGKVRNTLALLHAADLRHWEVRAVLLRHPDAAAHAFQYVDWQFDGNDIVAVSRTAFDDGEGGANRYHDANFLTFHRFKDFRKLRR
ncbi:MAG TPA: sialidase family protein [Verrucomicrobiae bacterium]|nr:sialidase family protein [Verrucomicrobiae bacterium]